MSVTRGSWARSSGQSISAARLVPSHILMVTHFETHVGKRIRIGSSTVRSMEGRPARNRAAVSLRHRESSNRDDAVCGAAAAGLGPARIQRITGPGATTIMRVVDKGRAGLVKGVLMRSSSPRLPTPEGPGSV